MLRGEKLNMGGVQGQGQRHFQGGPGPNSGDSSMGISRKHIIGRGIGKFHDLV